MKTKPEAKRLQSMGEGGDTILAHINPQEAALLKAHGGSGKRNPKTGLLSFGGYEGGGTDMGDPGGNGGGDWSGADVAALAAATGVYSDPSSVAARLGIGQLTPRTDQQDANALLAFDQSQPAPLGDGWTAVLNSIFPGLGSGYNALNARQAESRQGAGYGSGLSSGNNFASFGNAALGGFQGGGGPPNELGAVLPGSSATGATSGTGEPPPPIYAQQPFVRKFGRPRGMLAPFTSPYEQYQKMPPLQQNAQGGGLLGGSNLNALGRIGGGLFGGF